ncbi:uncharacterized protein [Coffea arabica]|uniref:Uncharacterized protein isoform X1 n=1 Tax=Coffea arabica TaxID=13443 RepID=A0ABM4V0L3_COFAR
MSGNNTVDPLPSAEQRPTTIMDLNMDSLVHCTSHLNLQDISNMAMSCKYLRAVAYSDSVWQSLSRARWPSPIPYYNSQKSSVRDAYLARHTALEQLKFEDPVIDNFLFNLKSHDHLLFLDNRIILSEGPVIHTLDIGINSGGYDSVLTLNDHRARITCMRLFSLSDTTVCRSGELRNSTVLVTSSCDHTIRLWSKGSCYRCYRGHSGGVTTLSDKLLGDSNEKIFASGGVDGTVRLWSSYPKGKRGQQALKATLYGHEKPVILMVVAGHRSSLLVSMSKDSKVRVWDAFTSSAARSSCCVGMTSVYGVPVGMKCDGSLLYVATGSSVVVIDLRTMREVSTVMHKSQLYSFDVLPSRSLICTGATGSAKLWDLRRSSETFKAEPLAELDGHEGPVKHIRMDAYKIVTGGPDDCYVKVWEVDTGAFTNSLNCAPDHPTPGFGCSAVAVRGCRIVTAGSNGGEGSLCYRDFSSATQPVSSDNSIPASKFWDSSSYSDTDESYD